MEVRAHLTRQRSCLGTFQMTDLAEAIYRGKVGVEGAAGLRNPIVKLATIAVPLLTVVFQHTARALGTSRLSNGEIVIAAVLCYIAVIIDFEPRNSGRFISRCLKWTSFVAIMYLFSLPTYEQYLELLAFLGRSFHVVYVTIDFLVDSESLMTMLLFVPMYLAIRNFTTRDALWIGRKFLWGLLWNTLFEIYIILIVAVATINSALPLRISASWIIAKDKAILLKNPGLDRNAGWFSRLRTRVRLFSATLIGHNTRLANAIETMTHQRGMFRTRYQDQIAVSLSREDCAAMFLFGLAGFVIGIGRLH
jgi:hypothetical protein